MSTFFRLPQNIHRSNECIVTFNKIAKMSTLLRIEEGRITNTNAHIKENIGLAIKKTERVFYGENMEKKNAIHVFIYLKMMQSAAAR